MVGCDGGDAGEECPTGLAAVDVVSHEVSGLFVRLDLEYAGGCGAHDFAMWWTGLLAPSCPAGYPIELQHYVDGETCDDTIAASIWIDLSLWESRFCNGAANFTVMLGDDPPRGIYSFDLPEDAPVTESPESAITINRACGNLEA